MKTLKDAKIKEGDVVLLRCDFNVSIEDGDIKDDFRIKSSIPTIEYLKEKNAKTIIIAHLGRPEGKDENLSLKPVARRLGELVSGNVLFFKDLQSAKENSEEMKEGDIAVLENIRFDDRETEGSEVFAKELAELGGLYINDAFGVSHRKHTSVYHLAKELPSVAGLLLEKETKALSHVAQDSKHPLVFLVGGAKAETKLKTSVKLIDRLDTACFGGILANSILQKRGVNTGKSKVEEGLDEYIEKLDASETEIILPVDAVVSEDFSGEKPVRTTTVDDIADNETMVDIGPETIKLFSSAIKKAGTIVWNGPVGYSEVRKFAEGTYSLAETLKDTDAFVVVGGGDVMRAIDETNTNDSIDHTSTGGGAMLEYLADGTLPALEVLN